ncbi:VIT1/CCC1 transporter family protein [Frigoriflavimonas asaccharolytica]|uniref:VIT1/CCC1 family predicted Fe2+/Mn2+ transporter n=1 Tax=Frigoriflavimonas asaccharolytica TaxID=2735899 RepID=A0A8J8K792_9FLAO|nr:VIT family protein [Frigoriflavimonas asaccharolytica]NRS91261.1 VIT1/CCC1 family predicted Fe2+/Mn2+ transporter [Frigoriflavimonas asaccharolytica]
MEKEVEFEDHFINRSNWIRAAVLGANDGILSVGSIAIGVAAAGSSRENLLLATLAGLVAGVFAMAAGEYVSVSSQADIEEADLKREAKELEEMPELEMRELAKIYQKRGLTEELSMQVAQQLHDHDALGAHARDELGINEIMKAKPFEAAFASGASFVVGGVLPLLVCIFLPLEHMMYYQYGFTTIFLVILGYLSARGGGSHIMNSILRVLIWGTLAMIAAAFTGYLFGVNVG